MSAGLPFSKESWDSLPLSTLARIERLATGTETATDLYWAEPWRLMEQTPDPWQSQALDQLIIQQQDLLILASRQIGKTTVVAAAAYLEACLGGFVLIISPSDDQSKEFFQRLKGYHDRLQLVEAVEDPTQHQLRLANGGRALALPNNERTVRVYSAVSLLVIDEASRVPDELFAAVSPMLAVSHGRTALLSTPFGRRGFFWDQWENGGERWKRHKIEWWKCPRLTEAFIEGERRKHGDAWIRQEFGTEFIDVISSPLDAEAFESLIDHGLQVVESW